MKFNKDTRTIVISHDDAVEGDYIIVIHIKETLKRKL